MTTTAVEELSFRKNKLGKHISNICSHEIT